MSLGLLKSFTNNRFIWWSHFAVLVLAGLLYALILGSGCLAGIGFEIRYDSVLLPLALACVFYAITRIEPRWHWPVLLLLFVSLCGMVLSSVWVKGVSDLSVMAGHFQLSDAYSYLNGSLNLMYCGQLTDVASRRPISPALGAIMLFVCRGHVKCHLALPVFFTAIGISWSARELMRTHGYAASYVFSLGLFLFYRRFIGTVLTEHVGLLFGMVAFAMIWRSAYNRSRIELAGGVFALSTALFARAGAFFVLPAILLWASRFWRKKRFVSRSVVAMACVAMCMGCSISFTLSRTVGKPNVPMGNFGYALYGMLNGGNWQKVLEDHPEVIELPEAEKNQVILNLAKDIIKKNPLSLITGSARAVKALFFSFEGAYSFVRFGLQRSIRAWPHMTSFSEQGLARGIKNNSWKYIQISAVYATYIMLYLFALIGLLSAIRARAAESYGLLLWAVLGTVASAPFAPPWDSDLMRAYAATMPFLLAIPAVGLASIKEQYFGIRKIADQNVNDFSPTDIVLVLIAVIIIPFICLSPILLSFETFRMKNDHVRIISAISSDSLSVLPGSSLYVHENHGGSSLEDVKRYMGVLVATRPEYADSLRSALDSGHVMGMAFDMSSCALRHVVYETGTDTERPLRLLKPLEPDISKIDGVWWQAIRETDD
jgi:hypothetical protein